MKHAEIMAAYSHVCYNYLIFLLWCYHFPMATFIWTNSTNDALFLEFLDISVDIAYVNTNEISHFLSCYLGISFD